MERPNPEPDEGSTQNQASEDRKFMNRAMVLAEGQDSAQEPAQAPPTPTTTCSSQFSRSSSTGNSSFHLLPGSAPRFPWRLTHPEVVHGCNCLLEVSRDLHGDVLVEARLHRAEGRQRGPVVEPRCGRKGVRRGEEGSKGVPSLPRPAATHSGNRRAPRSAAPAPAGPAPPLSG